MKSGPARIIGSDFSHSFAWVMLNHIRSTNHILVLEGVTL